MPRIAAASAVLSLLLAGPVACQPAFAADRPVVGADVLKTQLIASTAGQSIGPD